MSIFTGCHVFKFNDDYQIKDEEWLTQLPNCPCEEPGDDPNDGWAWDAKADLKTYHVGANHCYRSYPAVKTSQGKSCQQCCYDENGKLIVDGSAAGTPDRESSCKGENDEGIMKPNYTNTLAHAWKDVIPYFRMSMENYHKSWQPNQGDNCND